MGNKRHSTELSDAEWERLRLLASGKQTRHRTHDSQTIFDVVFYVP